MTGEAAHAALAISHLSFAAGLAALFAIVVMGYLLCMWRVAGQLTRGMNLLIHTLYLLWQSNIAFVAVVALSVAQDHRSAAGVYMEGWSRAPAMLPSAVLLYVLILGLSVAIIRLRANPNTREQM